MFKKKNDNVYCCITSIHGVFPLVLWVHKKRASVHDITVSSGQPLQGSWTCGPGRCDLLFEGTPEKNGQVIFPVSLRNNLQVELNQVYQYIIFGLDFSSISLNL